MQYEKSFPSDLDEQEVKEPKIIAYMKNSQ